MSATLDQLAKEIVTYGEAKGWTFTESDIPEKLCLVHSEISEALEEFRDGRRLTEVYFSEDEKPEGFGIELADAIIRILHICGKFSIPIGSLVDMKMDYNDTRPYRHGGKRI